MKQKYPNFQWAPSRNAYLFTLIKKTITHRCRKDTYTKSEAEIEVRLPEVIPRSLEKLEEARADSSLESSKQVWHFG